MNSHFAKNGEDNFFRNIHLFVKYWIMLNIVNVFNPAIYTFPKQNAFLLPIK